MKMIRFVLSTRSGVPTYVQLERQVKQALRVGLLQVGDQLPTAKDVVEQHAINPNTVLKAYRELEREGLVAAKPGLGTFVTGSLNRVPPEDLQRLRRQLSRWLKAADEANLDRDDVVALFETEVASQATERSA